MTDQLAAEQEHLAESRTHLARMRRRAESLDRGGAGDRISQEVLDATLAERVRQLADDPTVPLFFGRLDTQGPPAETFHIGRRHVGSAEGDPLVIDWRAPVSAPFYRASRTEPLGIARRRRFGFQHGRLTSYEDEDLAAANSDDDAYSAILEAEIERPRVGPMRDIVATIQPEQDVIVRAGLDRSICVQGAPGTGKTAVGLHRAAYLLYAHRDQLSRQGVLVVGPNASFLGYIRDVLPALGEIDATQATIAQLVGAGVAVRGADSPEVATLKGDARMAEVLHRAVWSQPVAPTEGLVVPRGARRWRVPVDEVAALVASLGRRGVRYGAARDMLPRSLAHLVLVAMEEAGEAPDDRVQDAVARGREVKAYAAAVWPKVTPGAVVHRLLSDPDHLAEHADGLLDAREQRLLLWDRPARTPGTARWSLSDAVLLDEAADLVVRTGSVGHLVVDEAQDLSPMMLRALARRSSTGSLTVLGDLAQATTPWATRSWEEALAHLGKPDAHVEQLTRGFRVPGEVIELAARLLPHIAPGLEPPTAVRRSRGELRLVPTRSAAEVVDLALVPVLPRPGTVGLIAPDADVPALVAALDAAGTPHVVLGADAAAEGHLEVVPASLAKGLEFDHVVLVEPAAIVAAEPARTIGLRRLYVCLTRAVSSLTVAHAEPLPPELGGD